MKRIWKPRNDWGQSERPPLIETVEEYNDLVRAITKNREIWFDEFVKLCWHYYQSNPTGGNLHAVLDDGNLEDTNLDWAAGLCCGENDQEGSDIANLMRWMSPAQRRRVYRAYPFEL